MIEITLEELEDNFDIIMNNVDKKRASYLIILPDGERLMLVPQKNKIIEKMENEGLIKNLIK